MNQEQDFNNMVTSQLGQASTSLEYINTHSAAELKECEENAEGSFNRVQGYITNAHAANAKYLKEADAMVTSIEGQVAELQAGTGVGTASQYVEPTATPSPTPEDTWKPTTLFQKMPMAQRTKLKMLAIKYVAEDRSLENAGDIAKVLADIRASITKQKATIDANKVADITQATSEKDSEVARCNKEQTMTIKSITERHDNLASQKSQSDARLTNAKTEEATARSEMNVACAAADAAETLLKQQTPILQDAHDACDAAAKKEYDSCQATADGEIKTCTTYLEGEARTILAIQKINANLGSQQVAGAALLQAAGRFIRHVVKKNSKVQMPELYTTDLSKYKDIKDEILGLLNDMKMTATAGIATENTRSDGLNADNAAQRDTLKSDAEQALVDCTAEQNRLVAAAQAVHDAKLAVKTTRDLEWATADAACTAAQGFHATQLETQAREVAICTQTHDDSKAAADATFGENMGLAESKLDTSLNYLSEETATLAELRTALASLGQDASECAAELLQKGTLSAEQTKAVVSLLALSGKSQYDNAERKGYDAGSHTQTCKIEDLLKEIDADIAAEITVANSNFDADKQDILNDKNRAYAKAEGILQDCKDYHQKLVDDAKADMDKKCDVELPRALAAQTKAQAEFDTALKLLVGAKETREETIATCTETRNAALIQADKFFDERATTIQNDHAAEETRLQTTIAQSKRIVKLVEGLNFTASTLLQAKTEAARSSYRTEDSGDEKTKIADLITSLQTQVRNERSRSDSEFLTDNANNEQEKTRADDDAAAVAKADIDSLQAAVDTAREAKTAAEPELQAATEAHQIASDAHNANMDTRATAQKIQATNTPNFEKDLEETQAVADKILAKQEELHLKCKLSEKYLEITEGYVTLIQTAASSVSTDALSTTVNSPVSVDDSYTAADTVGMIANAHQSIKAQLAKETDTERARCRREGVETPGCHEDEAGQEAWNHDTHVSGNFHANAEGMGENQQYDVNGEATSARRLLSSQTLGSVISTILRQINDEQTRVGAECAKQEATFSGQKVDTYAVAQGHYDVQMKEDADRLDAAQLAEASSAAVLTTALTRKQTAQSDYDEKAATLRDALATQEKYVPVVNQQKADSLATNIKRFDAASAVIKESKEGADAKYAEQDALLTEVKAKVEAGLNKEELLQSLTTVVKKIVKTRLYDFAHGSADDFKDKAAGNYHDNGQAGVKSTEYSGDTGTLTGMINKLIADNNNQLEVVKTSSDADIAAEVARRDDRIKAADKTLQAELDRLQKDVNFANKELVAAQAAEDAQKIIQDAAIADRKLKESIFYQTQEEGNNRKKAALEKRVTGVSNANAAYTSETAEYARSLKTQGELLDYELSVVAQVRAGMNGEELGASPEMKKFDHCTDEKAASDAAATQCSTAKSDCEHSKITALNDGSLRTSRRLLSVDSCDSATVACKAKETTRAAYGSCLGPAQLLSTEELKAAFVQLHSKYASETAMSDTFSEHKDQMEILLSSVETKIGQERSAAHAQHDADVASSLAKKTKDVADCIAAERAVIDKWDSKIAVAQAAWDAAAEVEGKEIAEYNRLVTIKNDKQTLYDAAANRQQTEGATARKLHKEDVDGAWEYYTDMHGSITSVATSDYEYLTEELESLQTILDIVNQLNLDGDTNAEYVAPEHVTNDFATDAAEAKAGYHGGEIAESNSEGRAGEGALVQTH